MAEQVAAGGPLHDDAVLGERVLSAIEDLQRLLDAWQHRYDFDRIDGAIDDDLPF